MPGSKNDLESLLKELIQVNHGVLDTLQTLVKVSAIQVGGGLSITERARALKMTGLDNQTIADVLNTSRETISVVTANLRTAKTKKLKIRIVK
jgi:hypothetical protein